MSNNDSNSEKKPKVNINDGDWKLTVGNDIIYFSRDLGKWYCVECDEIIDSAPGAGSHKKVKHQLVSTEDSDQDNDSTEENKKEADRTSSEKLRKELFGDSIKYDKGIKDTGDLALQINIEEESKLVSQLIKNPYVTFTFAKLRDERKIYPDWTLADFLREGALYLCKKLGCEIGFEFNIDLLKQDKEFAEIAVKINESWEEYDAEQKLLHAGTKQN